MLFLNRPSVFLLFARRANSKTHFDFLPHQLLLSFPFLSFSYLDHWHLVHPKWLRTLVVSIRNNAEEGDLQRSPRPAASMPEFSLIPSSKSTISICSSIRRRDGDSMKEGVTFGQTSRRMEGEREVTHIRK